MTAVGWAHGRVNIIGEHTDYNGGLALPTLIPQRTTVEVRPRADGAITLRSHAPGLEPVRVDLAALEPRRDWSDHVVGVAAVLRRRGNALRGFDGVVRSNVPVGAGLSSSAALLIATARALREAFGLSFDDREAALVAHEAEDAFVGAHVGLMDQLVCSLGREHEALLIDFRDLATRRVRLPGVELAVIDSGVRHDHATGGYNERRRECADAAQALGVSSLRDVAPDADLGRLPETLRRRARHVVAENARVRAAVDAIERGDVVALGAILNASHASLRDDFAVSVAPIDAIVAAAQRDADVYGARMVGGGFGGCVVMLCRPGTARAAAARVTRGGARVVVPI